MCYGYCIHGDQYFYSEDYYEYDKSYFYCNLLHIGIDTKNPDECPYCVSIDEYNNMTDEERKVIDDNPRSRKSSSKIQ